MKHHLFRKIPDRKLYFDEDQFVRYQEGSDNFSLENDYGGFWMMRTKDIDRLIEILQEIKGAIKS